MRRMELFLKKWMKNSKSTVCCPRNVHNMVQFPQVPNYAVIVLQLFLIACLCVCPKKIILCAN